MRRCSAASPTLVQAVGGTLGRQLPILDAQVADVPNASLTLLSLSSLVKRIAMDRPTVATMERTGATIGSALARQQFGYDGTGVTVAVIDSGVTSWHDDLSGSTGSQRIDQFVNLVGGHPGPYDEYGHGTHVAGIIAGNGFDSGGARTGVAPGARLGRVEGPRPSRCGRISEVIAAFDYAIAHRHVFSILGDQSHRSERSWR